MRLLLSSLLAFLLAACGTVGGTRVQSENPTITYRFADGEDDVVQDQADDYCSDYNGRAVLRDVDNDGAVNVATFECIRDD